MLFDARLFGFFLFKKEMTGMEFLTAAASWKYKLSCAIFALVFISFFGSVVALWHARHIV
jgi:hypothetical protein